MSDQGGGDRPRWEGFPGGVDPDQYAAGPGGTGYQPPGPEQAGPPDQPHPTAPVPGLPTQPQQPEPPQFPVHQADEGDTGPVPVVGAPVATAAVAAATVGPRQAARSHSAPRPHTSRYVSIACAAAVVLVAAGFGFVACNNDGASTAGSSPPAVPITIPTSASVLPSNSPIPTRSVSATPSRTASRTTDPSATASSSASASSSPSATAKAVKQPVVVLNSTAINGLAKRVAAQITAGGWTVTKTTNWTGAKPAVTTIYYKPGAKNKASAILFKNKFDVAVVARPALPGMTGPLTLVLTRDAA